MGEGLLMLFTCGKKKSIFTKFDSTIEETPTINSSVKVEGTYSEI